MHRSWRPIQQARPPHVLGRLRLRRGHRGGSPSSRRCGASCAAPSLPPPPPTAAVAIAPLAAVVAPPPTHPPPATRVLPKLTTLREEGDPNDMSGLFHAICESATTAGGFRRAHRMTRRTHRASSTRSGGRRLPQGCSRQRVALEATRPAATCRMWAAPAGTSWSRCSATQSSLGILCLCLNFIRKNFV